jgi:hypothetical protein
MEDFFEERRIRSSPTSPLSKSKLNLFGMGDAGPADLAGFSPPSSRAASKDEPDHEAPREAEEQPPSDQAGSLHPVVLRLSEVIEKLAPMGAGGDSDEISTAAGSSVIPSSQPSGPGSASLAIDATRAVPDALGTPELPSRGSALHRWGACKPCAFVFSEGCANGTECPFCHLCEPGEKRRRRKERRRMAAQVEMAQTVAAR